MPPDEIDYPAIISQLQSENERLRMSLLRWHLGSIPSINFYAMKAWLVSNAELVIIIGSIMILAINCIQAVISLLERRSEE